MKAAKSVIYLSELGGCFWYSGDNASGINLMIIFAFLFINLKTWIIIQARCSFLSTERTTVSVPHGSWTRPPRKLNSCRIWASGCLTADGLTWSNKQSTCSDQMVLTVWANRSEALRYTHTVWQYDLYTTQSHLDYRFFHIDFFLYFSEHTIIKTLYKCIQYPWMENNWSS